MADVTSAYGNGPQTLESPVPVPAQGGSAGGYQPPPELKTAGMAPAQASGYKPPPELANAGMPQQNAAPVDSSNAPAGEPGLLEQAKQSIKDPKTWLNMPGAFGLSINDMMNTERAVAGSIRGVAAETANVMAAFTTGQFDRLSNPVLDVKAISNTLAGRPPSGEEYLTKLGVGKGLLGTFRGHEVTVRGALGLAADIASDVPIGAVSRLAQESSLIAKLINMPGTAMEKVGEVLQKSATRAGAAKTAGQMIENAQGTAQAVGGIRQGLFEAAASHEISVDASNMAFTRTQKILNEMQTVEKFQPASETLGQGLNTFKQSGPKTLEDLSNFRNSIFNSAYEAEVAKSPQFAMYSKDLKAALSADVGQEIKIAGNSKLAGLGDSINRVDNQYGQLLEALPTTPPPSGIVDRLKKIGSLTDLALISSGHVVPYAVKKVGELAASPIARQFYSKALLTAGRSGIASGAVINGLGKMTAPEGEQ